MEFDKRFGNTLQAFVHKSITLPQNSSSSLALNDKVWAVRDNFSTSILRFEQIFLAGTTLKDC